MTATRITYMSKSTKKVKIENNVPLPNKSGIPPLPLPTMSVGESFALSPISDCGKNTIRQRVSRYQLDNPPRKYSVRTIKDDEVRVFRVEDAIQ
jgi:hypothetical protein